MANCCWLRRSGVVVGLWHIAILATRGPRSVYSDNTVLLPSAASLSLACWLVVIAAIIKTAQFPFHVWLPQTLETPTPVSALMHAAWRRWRILDDPIRCMVCSESAPLVLLTLAGTVTAVYGAVVMSTQPSIKRQLAYSTVAQMGFMMLQCGWGLSRQRCCTS